MIIIGMTRKSHYLRSVRNISIQIKTFEVRAIRIETARKLPLKVYHQTKTGNLPQSGVDTNLALWQNFYWQYFDRKNFDQQNFSTEKTSTDIILTDLTSTDITLTCIWG